MTLHIYADKDCTQFVTKLEYEALDLLAPVFQSFRDRTSVEVSEYQNLTLYDTHCQLLAKIIAERYKMPMGSWTFWSR